MAPIRAARVPCGARSLKLTSFIYWIPHRLRSLRNVVRALFRIVTKPSIQEDLVAFKIPLLLAGTHGREIHGSTALEYIVELAAVHQQPDIFQRVAVDDDDVGEASLFQ